MNHEVMKAENRKARMLRGLSGKSQRRAAGEIGRSATLLDQWEQGERVPGEEDLKRLAERTAGISREDADELMALYETQRQAFRRRSEGMGAVVDALVESQIRHGARAVRRLLKLPLPQSQPSPEDRRKAEIQLAELKRLDSRLRLAVVRLNPEYQTWALMETCCEAAVEEGSQDLKQSAAWARLALAIAKWVRGSEEWRRRGRGYALSHWANLLKVRGDLTAADGRLEEAKGLWLAGSDPTSLLDPGRLLDLEGSLRKAQRRFAEALSCFEQAVPISRFPERALIMAGATYDAMGDHEQAIAALQKAAPYLDRRDDPRLKNMWCLNLGSNLVHASRYDEAADLINKVKRCPAGLGQLDLARIPWLEGRIQAGLGRRSEALRLLAEARERFAAADMFYDVALALLEEAALLLDEGRTEEVKALALELARVFEAKGVHREALAALKVFGEAVRREAASADLARKVLRFLFQARHDQGLRFE